MLERSQVPAQHSCGTDPGPSQHVPPLAIHVAGVVVVVKVLSWQVEVLSVTGTQEKGEQQVLLMPYVVSRQTSSLCRGKRVNTQTYYDHLTLALQEDCVVVKVLSWQVEVLSVTGTQEKGGQQVLEKL